MLNAYLAGNATWTAAEQNGNTLFNSKRAEEDDIVAFVRTRADGIVTSPALAAPAKKQ